MLYIDTYKILKFKLKNGLATEAEYQMISYYDEIEDLHSLYQLLFTREDYLSYSIGCVETFNNIPYLGKIRIMKSLSEDENSKLSTFSELHNNDMDKYNIDITEDFIMYFQKVRQCRTN